MTCRDCQLAKVGPHHGYAASCPVCTARGVGRGPGFAESARHGFLTPRYQSELKALGLSHAEIKAARLADFDASK